ncbi:MAG: TraB/GumN family protein [Sphingomicrobium sp.]
MKSLLKSVLRRVLPAFGISLAFGAAPATAKASELARPALWEVSDPDTTIYLFGTIHLLPEKMEWRSPKLDQAVAGSQELVVETIVDEKNPLKLMSALASLGFANGLPPLVERVPAAKRPALLAAIKKSGFPPQALDRMKTWTASFILLGNKYKELGLKGQEGVEQVLRSSFSGAGKPIDELETNVEQLGFFDRLPEPAQRSLLEGAIDDSKATDAEFAGMLKAWSRGDVEGIARTFDRDLSGSPALQQALIRQRNANWSKWIEQRLAQPGAIMVAVGAGHLAGKDSVLELLKKDGYKVRRLQ